MVLALLILNVLLGVLCLVVARGERESRPLRLWGWGLLTYAAGLLVTLASFLPLAVSKVVGNSLIAFAPILNVVGVLGYTRLRLRRRWLAAGFVASVVPIVVNHLGDHYSVLVDFLSPAPLANLLFLIGAVTLLRDPPPDAKAAARFLSALFLLSIAVWTLRMLLLWLSVGGSNDRDRADLTVALFAIAQMVIAVGLTLGLLWVEVRLMQATLERFAYSDPLTGIPNRRATLMRFREEAARALRHQRPLAMVLLDIDHFKRINDTFGHLAGDAVLQHITAELTAGKRTEDVLGRIGGEEFVALLTGQPPEGALDAADRLRVRVEGSKVTHDGHALDVTVSAGVALFPTEGSDWDSLFTAADRRLYAAKQAGRNRVVGPTT
jgi:diguanylate cyclase (GGDEF)-like protein